MTGNGNRASKRQRFTRRASMAVKFALIALPVCTIIFFIFAVGLHLYYQELLDIGLHLAMRQVQTGSAQNIASGDAFVTSYLCPAMGKPCILQ
jgi:Flp pilus assembly protein TadG